MKTTRPVFESFEEFVNFMSESIEGDYDSDYLMEGENDPGGSSKFLAFINSFDGLYKSKLAKKDLKSFNDYFKTFISDSDSEILSGYLSDLTNFLGNPKDNKIVDYAEYITDDPKDDSVKGFSGGKYPYMVYGTCKCTGFPIFSGSGESEKIEINKNANARFALNEVLIGIFKNNMKALSETVKGGEKTVREMANGGKRGKGGLAEKLIGIKNTEDEIIIAEPYTTIDSQETISGGKAKNVTGFGVHKFSGDKRKRLKGIEYIINIPVYYLDSTYGTNGIKDSTNAIGEEEFVRVLPAAGSSVEVTDKPFSPNPESKFFESNKVELTESGKTEMRAFISSFNKITKIVVTGGASSFSTSYTSPIVEKDAELKKKMIELANKSKVLVNNLYLAYDRMTASYDFFMSVKKDEETDQLKGIEDSNIIKLTPEELIESKDKEGNFLVQRKEEKGDSKKQQTTFKIDGFIKGSSGQGDNEPVIIKDVRQIFAKEVKIALKVLSWRFSLGKSMRTYLDTRESVKNKRARNN